MPKSLGVPSIFQTIRSWFITDIPDAPVIQQKVSLENPANGFDAETIGAISRSGKGDDVTHESSLSITAFWRAIDILSGVIASLPIGVFQVTENESKRKFDHPIATLLNRSPSQLYTKFDFMQTLVLHLKTFGNFYAKISRNGTNGMATSLTILPPNRVTNKINTRNNLVYVYKDDDGKEITYPADRIIHVSGLSWTGMLGMDIVELFDETLEAGIFNQEFITNFYENGAHLGGVIESPMKLDKDARQRIRSSWDEAYKGTKKAGATAVLEQGAKYTRIGISPVEAGAADARKMTVADVARITGVPQFLLEDLDRATFNNIEHLGQLFVTYTIFPATVNICQELTRKLLPERQLSAGYEIQMDLKALLKADTEATSKLIDALMKWGIINRDEARRIQGMNPIKDGSGSEYFVPMNMVNPNSTEPGQNQTDNAQNSIPGGQA